MGAGLTFGKIGEVGDDECGRWEKGVGGIVGSGVDLDGWRI